MSSSGTSTEYLNTIEYHGVPLPDHPRATTTANMGGIGEPSRERHTYTSESEPLNSAPRTPPWDDKSILSLDGGGIRGLFSLHILHKLMELIASFERESLRHDGRDEGDFPMSSFHPAPNSANFSPAYSRSNEHSQCNNFLPCHYFDYICGTSTGGLIAIMLTRFRMSVDDCMEEYHKLAGDVFGHPRKLHMINTVIIPRHKYNEKVLETAIKKVARHRSEATSREATSSAGKVRFKTESGICRAFVFATMKKPGCASETYIFRSYDHHRGSDDPRGYPRNPGAASDYEVWEVGRATTAAALYFKPLKLHDEFSSQTSYLRTLKNAWTNGSRTAPSPSDRPSPSNKTLEFTDGGMGPVNNPSTEAWHEVTTGGEKVGLMVGVGTARGTSHKTSRLSTLFGSIIKDSFTQMGETQSGHKATKRLSQVEQFEYFRFDNPEGLADVEFDDWKGKDGNDTREHIKSAFNTWVRNRAVASSFEACAQDLVRRRRQRTQDLSRWERFACRSSYICGERGCRARSGEDKWKNQNDFIAHLRNPDQGHAQNINFEDPNVLQRIFAESRRVWQYQATTNGHDQ